MEVDGNRERGQAGDQSRRTLGTGRNGGIIRAVAIPNGDKPKRKS